MPNQIPQQFIDDLLARIDIVDLIDSRVKLRKTGRNYSALCPFHQEKTPSFSVNPEKQFYYCFGCGAGGNALSFLMEYERLTFPEAVELLAYMAGVEIPKDTQFSEQDKKRQPLYEILNKIARYYQTQLRQHPNNKIIIDYLKERGLTGEIAKQYGLGYAPSGWDNVLQTFATSQHVRQQLIAAGMLISQEANKIYDRFRHRIMFPIRDSRGRVIAFGGRAFGDEKPKYLNSPETEVFHKGHELYGFYEMRQTKEKFDYAVVVEGYMDVIALAQHGFSNCVATLGTAISKYHLEKLFRILPEVIFCFDGDLAGKQAAKRALEIALPNIKDGRQIKFLFLPEGEDPDTIIREEGKDKFLDRIKQAMDLSEFFFTLHTEKIDMHSMTGRARLDAEASPFIKKMPKGVLQQLMLNKLAQLTGVENTASFNQSLDERRPNTLSGGRIVSKQNQKVSIQTPTRRAIHLLLEDASLASQLPENLLLTPSNDENVLLIELIHILKKNPDQSFHVLLNHWQEPHKKKLLMQIMNQDVPIPENKLQQEFNDVVQLLMKNQQEQELNHLLNKAKIEELSEEEKNRLQRLIVSKSQH